MENNYLAKKDRGKSAVFDCKNLTALITYDVCENINLFNNLASVEKDFQIWTVISNYYLSLI